MDLSRCRQLQDRQDEHDVAFQRGDGFSPPSSQDKIFGNNFGLKPERDLGWDIGVRQELWDNHITAGLTYFHNDLSNVIGLTAFSKRSTIGAAETQGSKPNYTRSRSAISCSGELHVLEAEKTSRKDVSQLQGLPSTNEIYARLIFYEKIAHNGEAKFVNAREELNRRPKFRHEDYSFVNIAAE